MCELDSGSRSARLQAGICLIPECPPEGGRYKNAAILCFTQILKPISNIGLNVAAETATDKAALGNDFFAAPVGK